MDNKFWICKLYFVGSFWQIDICQHKEKFYYIICVHQTLLPMKQLCLIFLQSVLFGLIRMVLLCLWVCTKFPASLISLSLPIRAPKRFSCNHIFQSCFIIMRWRLVSDMPKSEIAEHFLCAWTTINLKISLYLHQSYLQMTR